MQAASWLVPGILIFGTPGWSATSVSLMSSVRSPQMVGTLVGLEARATLDGDPEKQRRFLQYRFAASVDGGPFRVFSDFNGAANMIWRPDLYEHEARVKVTMRNTSTKESFESELPFRILPRAKTGRAAVTSTSVPLVALFSAEPCPEGSDIRVVFHPQSDDSRPMRTSAEPCRGTRTNNLYVAGMLADTTYQMRAEVIKGSSLQAGRTLSFHTGLADGAFAPAALLVPPAGESSSKEQVLVFTADRPTATDLQGNLIWYVPLQGPSLVRMLPGGRFLTLSNGGSARTGRVQTLAEHDLAGNIVRQTNMAIVAEQIEKRLGIKSICKRNGGVCIAGLHHDAIRLQNGHTIAIGTLERMFPEGAQGSEDPVDVMGSLLIDLDENFEVSWLWNAFDHLDISRKSIEDNKCRGTGGGLACAPAYLSDAANDWLHANAVSYSHKDGNLVVSLPEQNWVIKVDYQDGKGSGKVLWRLGEGGDLKSDSTDKAAWFSFQHDAAFEPAGEDTLVLFDNGHKRQKKDEKKDDKDGKADGKAPAEKAHSRGQVWKIDEQERKATLLVNADVGAYAPFMGSAQRLSNGNFHFTATVQGDLSSKARSVETTPAGKIVFTLQTGPTYRGFRMPDLYSPAR